MRIVTGEARDIPGLGQMFHEQGLARGWRITAEYFAELQRRGLWPAASLMGPPPQRLFETHFSKPVL
jgi:hypothetical protein